MYKETQALRGRFGGVAQLGEHLPCKQGVRGSNPLISTRYCEAIARMNKPKACSESKGLLTCEAGKQGFAYRARWVQQ